jgi:short-subunit dehydrogenase
VRIAGATVLLTGATGGIGHAVARAVAARGGQLILTGRRVEALDALAAELGARALAVELSDRVQVDRLIDDAGAVDLLIANAALPASGGIETFTVEELDRALEVNLRAPIVLARALLPAMLARRNGHLLFMSSLSGKSATTGSAVYSATKFGLRGFAAGLRADLHASSVGVSTVFPGFIRDAGMFANSGVRLPPGVGTRSPEDVAHAVIEAIERNRAEVDVAPLPLRAGAAVAGLAPELAMSVARRLGSDAIAREFARAQRDKR